MKYEKERANFVATANSATYNSSNAYLAAADAKQGWHLLGAGACHGGFSANSYGTRDWEVVFSARMVVQPIVAKLSKERKIDIEKEYYTWLLNESPWAEAYVDKDYEVVKKYGFAIRTDLPHNFVASACVATRFLTEKYSGSSTWVVNRIEVMVDLLDKGVPMLWAFILANMYNKHGSKGTYSYSMPSGHEMLPPNWSVKALKNFITGNYNKAAPTFRANRGYNGIGTAWRHSEGKSQHTSERAKYWIKKKVDVINNNIFEPLDQLNGFPAIDLDTLAQLPQLIQEEYKDE